MSSMNFTSVCTGMCWGAGGEQEEITFLKGKPVSHFHLQAETVFLLLECVAVKQGNKPFLSVSLIPQVSCIKQIKRKRNHDNKP